MTGHRGCSLGIAYPEITEKEAPREARSHDPARRIQERIRPPSRIGACGNSRRQISQRVAAQVMKEMDVAFTTKSAP